MQPQRLPQDPPAIDFRAITSAASELGVRLTQSQADTMAHYAALLLRWNTVHNLTAIDAPADVLTHHLLDSLAIVPHIQRICGERAVQALDVGSGGGLPGIPLAIAAPHVHVTLVDKVQKKVAFLTQAKLELGLSNVECVHARVETMVTDALFDLIIARAFASLAQLVRVTRHLIASHGWWCAMKGALQSAELDELKRSLPDVEVSTVKLRVPHLNAERHLVLMRMA